MRQVLRLILGIGLSFSVQAETLLLALSQIQGVVLVNQGQKFVRAHNDMLLVEGDRLLIMKESQVALKSEKYDCSSLVKGSSLLIVTENLDCEALAMLQEEGTLYAALGDDPGASLGPDPQGNGQARSKTNNPNSPNNPNPHGGWLTPAESLWVGFGTVFAGAGVAAGIAATEDPDLATPDKSGF